VEKISTKVVEKNNPLAECDLSKTFAIIVTTNPMGFAPVSVSECHWTGLGFFCCNKKFPNHPNKK
jgi:hypothetical protein